MFLPVEVSEDGLVGFISSTLSFSGSLSPSLTRRVASEGFYDVCLDHYGVWRDHFRFFGASLV